MIVLVRDAAGDEVVDAFGEEERRCTVVGADVHPSAFEPHRVKAVVAASPSGVATAESLQRAFGLECSGSGDSVLRTDRSAQQLAVETSASSASSSVVTGARALSELLTRASGPRLVVPPIISDDDPAAVCHIPADAERAVAAVAEADGRVFVLEYGSGGRYAVDTVSADGDHVIVGIYEHRLDERSGMLRLRHRLSIRRDGDLEQALTTMARRSLTALGVRHGAAVTELEMTAHGPALVEMRAAVPSPAVLADAAFAAVGLSHQHLLAEQVLRPTEFLRRCRRPPAWGDPVLGLAVLPADQGGARMADASRIIRRLPGFHSMRLSAPGGVAAFVHRDRPLLESSLDVVHEIADSGAAVARGRSVIAMAADVG